jgi:predicted DNA-binding transcriptional regulator YafY
LHASQQELGPEGEWVSFEYFLIINYEWKRLMRGYGAEIRVVEPLSLAEELRRDFQLAYERYLD